MKLLVWFIGIAASVCGWAGESAPPRTIAGLQTYLEGTRWLPVGEPGNFYTFKEGRFVGAVLGSAIKITGPRALTMAWGGKDGIRCVLSDDCSTMTEKDGKKIVYQRERQEKGAVAAETLPASAVELLEKQKAAAATWGNSIMPLSVISTDSRGTLLRCYLAGPDKRQMPSDAYVFLKASAATSSLRAGQDIRAILRATSSLQEVRGKQIPVFVASAMTPVTDAPPADQRERLYQLPLVELDVIETTADGFFVVRHLPRGDVSYFIGKGDGLTDQKPGDSVMGRITESGEIQRHGKSIRCVKIEMVRAVPAVRH